MIKAAIFDLDGLLINSEPLWKQAEIEVFNAVGVKLTIDLCRQTTGLDETDVVNYWFNIYPWNGPSKKEVSLNIVKRVKELTAEKGELMPGANEVIAFMKSKGLSTGIASGSPTDLIMQALKKCKLEDRVDVVYSAENEEYSKPHPSVYLGAAKKMNIESHHCVSFEDSVFGMVAAKAARMKSVVVPDEHSFNNAKFELADLKLSSLLEFNHSHYEYLNKLP